MENIPQVTLPLPAVIFIGAVLVIFVGIMIKMIYDAYNSKSWPFGSH